MDRQMDRQIYRIDGQIDEKLDRQMDRQIYKIDGQIDEKLDRQMDRQMEIQIEIYIDN